MPARLTPRQIESMRILFMRGITYAAIADQSNVHIQTVQKIAKRHGWERPVVRLSSDSLSRIATIAQNGTDNSSKSWVEGIIADCQESLLNLRATPCYAVDEHHRRAQALKIIDDCARRAFGLDQTNANVSFSLNFVSQMAPKPIEVAGKSDEKQAQVVDVKQVDGDKVIEP